MPLLHPSAQCTDDDEIDKSGNHQCASGLNVPGFDHQEAENAVDPLRSLLTTYMNDLGKREDHRPQAVGIEPEAADDDRRTEFRSDKALVTQAAGQQHKMSGVDDNGHVIVLDHLQGAPSDHNHMRLVSV